VEVVTLTGIACSASTPATPAPTLVQTAISALTINNLPRSLRIGESVELTASVTLPNGTTKLADGVAWRSSNPAVATVSPTGVLSAVGSGGVDIVASAFEQEVSARLQVPFVITGIVHESAPTEEVRLPGARIEIVGSPATGQSLTADAEGRFVIEVEQPGFALHVSRDGYEPASFSVASLPRDQRPSIGLLPEFREIRDDFIFNDPPQRGLSVREATFPIPVHHGGRFMPVVYAACGFVGGPDCSASGKNYICADVRDGEGHVIARAVGSYDFTPQFRSPIHVSGGQMYHFRIFACDWGVEPAPLSRRIGYFRASVTHPN
jgi:hypothetical protein